MKDNEQNRYLEIFAPIILDFSSWVVHTALKQGFKRLYFLARDGYQFYLAAKEICKREEIDMDCRYLYVSRYSLRIPEYYLMGEKCVDYICTGGIDMTFEKLMQRAGVTEMDSIKTASMLGVGNEYRQVMSYQKILQWKEPLKKCPYFMNAVMKQSRQAYPNALQYLEQEGMLEEIPYAIVDSGWIGTTQGSLQRLIRYKNATKTIKGFYFGLYEIPKDTDSRNYEAYFFMPQNGFWRKAHFSNSLLEAVCSAPHGMTLGYEQRDGKIVPILNEAGNANMQLMQKQIKILQAFLEEYDGCVNKNKEKKDLYRLCRFMSHPTVDEAELFGNMQFTDDMKDKDLHRVSEILTEQEIANQQFVNKLLILTGVKKAEIKETAWIEGSIVRAGKHVRYHLFQISLYKYILAVRKACRYYLRENR